MKEYGASTLCVTRTNLNEGQRKLEEVTLKLRPVTVS